MKMLSGVPPYPNQRMMNLPTTHKKELYTSKFRIGGKNGGEKQDLEVPQTLKSLIENYFEK
jgi:hypothetical protein